VAAVAGCGSWLWYEETCKVWEDRTGREENPNGLDWDLLSEELSEDGEEGFREETDW
jgi:hypothetical protein